MKDSLRENVASLLPVVTNFERPFWDNLKKKKLMIQKCKNCGCTQFPPSPICINCLSDKVEWIECLGKAKLWSKVTFHKMYLKPYPDVPYSVVMAKLAEGHIVTGRIAEKNISNIGFDSSLIVDFCKTADGTVVIEFALDDKHNGC